MSAPGRTAASAPSRTAASAPSSPRDDVPRRAVPTGRAVQLANRQRPHSQLRPNSAPFRASSWRPAPELFRGSEEGEHRNSAHQARGEAVVSTEDMQREGDADRWTALALREGAYEDAPQTFGLVQRIADELDSSTAKLVERVAEIAKLKVAVAAADARVEEASAEGLNASLRKADRGAESLLDEECIAARLYTGPLRDCYTRVLRARVPASGHTYSAEAGDSGRGNFRTTCTPSPAEPKISKALHTHPRPLCSLFAPRSDIAVGSRMEQWRCSTRPSSSCHCCSRRRPSTCVSRRT